MQGLKLTVPAPGRVENPTLIRDPAALRGWVEDLPFATPADAGQALRRALSLLNRHRVPPTERLELMEVYQDAHNTLLDITRRALKGQACVAGSGPLQNLLELLGKLTQEMAYGFKLAINDRVGDLPRRKKGPGMPEALYFAAKQLALELMLRYTLYDPPPRNAWRELYLLYAEADRLGLAQTPTEDRYEPRGSGNVESVLKRAILLSLLDPYRKQAHETWQVYEFLAHHAPLCEITPAPEVPSPTGCFVFDLDGADPPRLCTKPPNDPARNSLQRLGVDSLLQRLDQNLAAIRDGGHSAPVGLESVAAVDAIQLLLGMRVAWKIPPKRRHHRHEEYTWLRATCGVGAAHKLLAVGQSGEPGDNAEPEDEIEVGTLREAPAAEAPANYPIFRWRQVNRSDSGAAVHVPLPSTASLQVGQLVVFEADPAKQPPDMRGGIVRRFRHIDPATLEVGLEFLAANMTPVGLRPTEGSGASGGFRAGISIASGGTERNSLEILTERGLYRKQREFVVDLGDDYVQIRAETLIESTSRFDRFRAQDVPLTAPIHPQTATEPTHEEPQDQGPTVTDPWHYVETPRIQR